MEPQSQTIDSGHLSEALIHFNEALDRIDGGSQATEVADLIFRCLNKLQTGRRLVAEFREVAEFVEMVTFATRTESMRSRFLGPELRLLAALDPQVMDHDVLRRGGYCPGLDIEPQLLRRATKEHRKLVNALERLGTGAAAEAIDQVIKRSAQLLYVVRSNIVHGEKTPYGPDLAKRERDELVCRLVVPLCRVLVDLLLEQPSHRLLAYGTLAPGEVNHGAVESIAGKWRRCTLEAALTEVAGLPVLSWQPGAPSLEAMLLESDELPEHWRRLDAFEGSAYCRRLVPVSTRRVDGSHGLIVASAYVGSRTR